MSNLDLFHKSFSGHFLPIVIVSTNHFPPICTTLFFSVSVPFSSSSHSFFVLALPFCGQLAVNAKTRWATFCLRVSRIHNCTNSTNNSIFLLYAFLLSSVFKTPPNSMLSVNSLTFHLLPLISHWWRCQTRLGTDPQSCSNSHKPPTTGWLLPYSLSQGWSQDSSLWGTNLFN